MTRRVAMPPEEVWFAARFRQSMSRAVPAAPLVMVEGGEHLFFYAVHGQIISRLRGVRDVRVARWMSNSLYAGATNSLQELVAGRLHAWIISRVKWDRLYRAFSDAGKDRADYLRAPWREASWAWRAWRLFRDLRSKDQLAALRVKDIHIGDLVIDSYLRFKPTVEVDLRDWYLFAVLRQAVKDVDTASAWFAKMRPSLYLATYSTYVQHGIPARVAVAMGIRTLTFANAQEVGTELTPEHLFHSKRCAGYSADFAKLPDRDAKLARAAEMLGNRLSGIPDSATSNQRSAYVVNTLRVPDVRGAAVVFLHDFYDSAHIYHWMLFHDFWEWACFTIETLQAAGRPFVLKPHPNQRAESGIELVRLQARYPRVPFISPEVSNRQLVDAGMACAITVYGSVAAEMAYLGVPSISCGDSPHASFGSFHLARSREGYSALLRDFPNLGRDAARMEAEACALYYMHQLNIRPDEMELRDRMIAFYLYVMILERREREFEPAEMSRILTELESCEGFVRFIAGLAAGLQPRMVSPGSEQKEHRHAYQ